MRRADGHRQAVDRGLDPLPGLGAHAIHLGSTCRAVVDEDGVAGIRAAGELDRLLRRQVAALGIVVGSQAEGALDEQQIRIPDGLLDGR